MLARSTIARAALLSLLVALGGCELVVDFDRDRIGDGGADMAVPGEDMLVPGEDMLVPGEDMLVPGEDMNTPVDMNEVDAFMCAAPAECDDSDECTVDDCTDSVCSNVALPCDDGNACTGTTCDSTTGCEFASVCSIDAGVGSLSVDVTTAVTVSNVMAGADGFLAVFAMDGTTLYGSTAVGAGANADVVVPLTERLADGDQLVVRLYEDAGVAGTFEPATDPVANDGSDVETTVTVAVPAGTPDIEVLISGDGTDYTFTLESSAAYAPAASLMGADPSITLYNGLRYRFVNDTPGDHPFELVTVGTPDVVQLSQAIDPALESDPTIDWTESGGAVELTVSTTLSAAVDGYRCSIHTSAMRGAVDYSDL